MITNSSSEILKQAKFLAQAKNSDFIEFDSAISLLNNEYLALYNEVVENSGEFVKSFTFNGEKTPLPDDCYKIQYVGTYPGNMEITRSPLNRDVDGLYAVENNQIYICGNPFGTYIVKYSVMPVSLTVPDEPQKLSNFPKDAVLEGMTGDTVFARTPATNIDTFAESTYSVDTYTLAITNAERSEADLVFTFSGNSDELCTPDSTTLTADITFTDDTKLPTSDITTNWEIRDGNYYLAGTSLYNSSDGTISISVTDGSIGNVTGKITLENFFDFEYVEYDIKTDVINEVDLNTYEEDLISSETDTYLGKDFSFDVDNQTVLWNEVDVSDNFIAYDSVTGEQLTFTNILISSPYLFIEYSNGEIYIMNNFSKTKWNILVSRGLETKGSIIAFSTDDSSGKGAIVYFNNRGYKGYYYCSFVPDTVLSYPDNTFFQLLEARIALQIRMLLGQDVEVLNETILPQYEMNFAKTLRKSGAIRIRNVLGVY